MNLVERYLPEHCYGQRRLDSTPFIRPSGILWHYISDKWGHYGDDPYSIDSVIQLLTEHKLSYHEIIDRDATVYLLVPTRPKCYRAWHAGESIWHGRPDCNDWMVGLALMGMHGEEFTDAQYDMAAHRTAVHVNGRRTIRRENITDHAHVAPDRKIDVGPSFDWNRYNHAIDGLWEPRGIT